MISEQMFDIKAAVRGMQSAKNYRISGAEQALDSVGHGACGIKKDKIRLRMRSNKKAACAGLRTKREKEK